MSGTEVSLFGGRRERRGPPASSLGGIRPARAFPRAAALLLVVALGACHSHPARGAPTAASSLAPASAGPGPTAAPTAPAPAPPPATATTTTTTAVSAPTNCPTGVGAAAQGASQAARCLYEAWRRDDRAGAATFASLDAVDTLFRRRWSPPGGTLAGCSPEPATGGETCRISYHGGTFLFTVQPSEGGWRVTGVQGGG